MMRPPPLFRSFRFRWAAALCRVWKKKHPMSRALRRQWTLAAQLSIRASRFALLHHPKIMLGVLVAILCLDPVAGLRRLTREYQIARIVPSGVPGRAVLA